MVLLLLPERTRGPTFAVPTAVDDEVAVAVAEAFGSAGGGSMCEDGGMKPPPKPPGGAGEFGDPALEALLLGCMLPLPAPYAPAEEEEGRGKAPAPWLMSSRSEGLRCGVPYACCSVGVGFGSAGGVYGGGATVGTGLPPLEYIGGGAPRIGAQGPAEGLVPLRIAPAGAGQRDLGV